MSNHIDGYKTTDKLTRRKVFKNAVAAGVSATAALNFTIDDARAASSDEVLISLDTEGRRKEYVPKAWYKRLTNARDAKRRVKEKFWGKEGINSISYSAGAQGGDNPHVIVGLDKNSDKKEERRGELPERSNDTRVDVMETTAGNPHCNPDYLGGSDTPGGLQIRGYDADESEGTCTLTSRMINGSDQSWNFGWATAAHCLDCPGSWEGQTQYFRHTAESNSRSIGWVPLVDTNLDIAVIAKHDGINELSEVANPQNPTATSEWDHISDTASENGLSRLQSRGITFKKRGASTCETVGNITGIDSNVVVNSYNGGYCENELENQVRWDGEVSGGDSGSLVYSEPVDGNRYASHAHSGRTIDDPYGPGGYAIKNQYNCWWSDL